MRNVVLFVALVAFGPPQVKSFNSPPFEHLAMKRHNSSKQTVGASECQGRKPQWVQEGPIKRLKGPVFNLHIPGPYHSAGAFMMGLASSVGGMEVHPYSRWAYVQNPQDPLWNDKHWIDLEEQFKEQHTLDDLGCGTDKAIILSTTMRHPLNMFLHRWFACNDWKADPRDLSEADKVCQHTYPMCEPEIEPCQWDNVILQTLVGKIEPTEPLTRADLELAKSRLRHFDLILIVEHFSHTLQLTTTRLGWRPNPFSNAHELEPSGHKAEDKEDQDRFTRGEITPEQWERVTERNSLDIELYDYARGLSFGMLEADGLPVPIEDERTVTPQWRDTMMMTPSGRSYIKKVLTPSRGSWQESRTE